MNELIITTKKSEVKNIVKNLSDSARTAVDTVFAYAPEMNTAAAEAEAAIRKVEPVLCESFSRIAADKDGIRKSGYKSFEAFGEAVFGFKSSLLSQYKRAGDKFFNVEKRPIVSEWYTVSKLSELRNVPNDKLDEDAKNGVLTPIMTQSALRAYAANVMPKAIEETKFKVVNPLSAMNLISGERKTFSSELEIVEWLISRETLTEALKTDIPEHANIQTMLSDSGYLHIVKSAFTAVIPATDKSKEKQVAMKTIIIEVPNSTEIRAARYYEIPSSLTKEEKAKVAAFRKMAASLGMDVSDKTDIELLEMAK